MTNILKLQAAGDPEEEQTEDLPTVCSQVSNMCSQAAN